MGKNTTEYKDDYFGIYKPDEFRYFVNEHTGEFETVSAKGETERSHPVMVKREISFEDIDRLDLDIRGESVPFSGKHVINLPRYMAYYWSPIIGDRACWLYVVLTTYCNRYDFLWTKLTELEYKLSKWSRPTLLKYLKVLEENNFIIIVHRFNKNKRNGREDSPIIKVRQTIPLLSEEQYNMLSESDKERHDDFIKQYCKSVSLDRFSYDSEDTKSELMKDSKVIPTKKMKKKIDAILEEEKAVDLIKTKLSFDESAIKNDELHQAIIDSGKFGKPTYDQAFSESISIYNEHTESVVMVISNWGKSIIDMTQDSSMFDKHLYGILEDLYKAKVSHIKYYSFEEYLAII
ncbi:TPA: hypothetical protein ACORDH_002729 [Bacillus cereus]